MSTHLEEILDKKKKQMEEQGKNWDAERNQWLKKTKGLFDIIKKWISPLEVKGYISISTSDHKYPCICFFGIPQRYTLDIYGFLF